MVVWYTLGMKKRIILRLRWDKHTGYWKLVRLHGRIIVDYRCTKAKAEGYAREYARGTWEDLAVPVQLLIHNKDGRIGKGGRSEASYGCDSKRRKG